jgi:hypothetical protein
LFYGIFVFLDVAYGSRVSLKHQRTGGTYLHSHAHLYPEDHPPRQQQVYTNITCLTLTLLYISNRLVHLYIWTKPFKIFRENFKIYTVCEANSADYDQMALVACVDLIAANRAMVYTSKSRYIFLM